jgi:hypothetical protein
VLNADLIAQAVEAGREGIFNAKTPRTRLRVNEHPAMRR